MKTLMFAVLACLAGIASATVPQQPSFTLPNSNPNYMPNLEFYGANTYRIDASTPTDTPVEFFTGTGYLYGIACSSGTSGDFALAFDTTSSLGITYATTGKALGPAVLSSVNGVATCTAGQVCGQWTPAGGALRITLGLAAIKHGSGGSNDFCQVFALPDGVIQANPQIH